MPQRKQSDLFPETARLPQGHLHLIRRPPNSHQRLAAGENPRRMEAVTHRFLLSFPPLGGKLDMGRILELIFSPFFTVSA